MSVSHDIQDFPFENLPHYTRADLALQKRVLKQYSFLEDSKDFFEHFLTPFRDLLPDEFTIDLLQVRALRLEELQAQAAHQSLQCLIKVLPQNKFAFLSFDPLLAKHLVTSALSGGKLTHNAITSDAIRSLTALEEGVVEYLVVSCLEKIESQFQQKDFSLRFEALLTAEQKLNHYFALQDEMALFSFLVSHPKKDFHFQFALPLTLGRDLGWDRSGEEFLQMRTHDFLKFKIDFLVHVGRVELMAQDFDSLSEGDIILLDKTSLTGVDESLQGRAQLIPEDSPQETGYDLQLGFADENLIAEITGVL